MTRQDRLIAGYYREILARVNGKGFSAAALRTDAGERVGSVFLYLGEPSWIFVVMRDGTAPGVHEVVLVPRRGAPVQLAEMRVGRDGAAWGARTSPQAIDTLAAVRLLDAEGRTRYEAHFHERG